jgi:30S ribosomal protein S31
LKKYITMGKGDKKSRKGKIFMGSYGKTRPQNSSSKNGSSKSSKATSESSKPSKESKG